MPGLLDDDLFNDPKKLGLLTMGLSLLSTPGRFGQAFGQAGLQGVQATRGAMKDAQQSQMAKLQMDEAKQRAQEAQDKREMALRMAQLAQRFTTPPQPARPGTADLNGMLPPNLQIGAQAPIPEKPGGFDVPGFLEAIPTIKGMNPIEALKTQAALRQQLAKPTVKYSQTPQFTPDGKAYVLGEDGSIRWLGGIAPRDKVISEDLGGKRIYRTEYSPTAVGEAAKTVSPDTMYSGGITMRGQNMTDRRASESNALKRGELSLEAGGPNQAQLSLRYGKPQAGYRWNEDGSLSPIPGGPADQKATMANQKSADTAMNAFNTVESMLKHPGLKTAVGLSGQLNPKNYVWGTDAASARALIEQVQGQAFLQAFESLKGGGQITQVEGEKATNAIARLQRSQSYKDFVKAARDLQEVLSIAHERATGKPLKAKTDVIDFNDMGKPKEPKTIDWMGKPKEPKTIDWKDLNRG